MAAIRAQGLARRFGRTPVLRSVDLVVSDGEHATISGANGSGKTTLLRILAGLLRPTEGTVTVLEGSTDDPEIRRRIGLISHSSSLYPRMTAMENIRFWGGMYGDSSAVARGAEILSALGLDPEDRRPVAAYSQGMRQRVAVARSLATAPDLVLADEPFAGLDTDGARSVHDLLDRVPTVVAVSHEAPEDGRRFVLRGGRLVLA